MIRLLIVEDEKPAVERLERLLSQVPRVIEIVARLDTIKKVVDYLTDPGNEVDLILLDIHLADGNSFSIFDEIQTAIPIIFVTAYDEYAIKAFKQNSIDYLLKPVEQLELNNAFQKYTSTRASTRDWKQLAQQLRQPVYQQRFMVQYGQKIRSVDTSSIAYFYADAGIVTLVCFDGSKYICDYTIDKLDQIVDPDEYFRINRKYIIHIDAISEMHVWSKSRVKIDLNPPARIEAIVSVERSSEFKKWLNK